jgi:hypothetical protein
MNMSHGAGIEDLLSPLKQRMEALEEENRTLKNHLAQTRQELADLRRGIGITVYIDGKPVNTSVVPSADVEMSTQGNGAFATPAVMNDRRPMSGPVTTVPSAFQPNIKQNGNPGGNGSRDGQTSRNNGYTADFFLD